MVTVITHVALKDGESAEWDAAMHDRLAAAKGQPGWIGGQLLKPLDDERARVIVGTWESRAAWESWRDQDPFHETAERLEGLQTGPAQTTWYEAIEDRRG